MDTVVTEALECLKCRRTFESVDKHRNRLCAGCNEENRALSRRDQAAGQCYEIGMAAIIATPKVRRTALMARMAVFLG
jgi:hypothetical protein